MNMCKIAGCVSNSANPDRTPYSAASDLNLQFSQACLPIRLYNEHGNLIESNPFRNHPGSAPKWNMFNESQLGNIKWFQIYNCS